MDFSIEFGEFSLIGPDFLVKLVAAIVCGGIVGFERESLGKAAGLRTCIMVCLGSMIFTVISVRMAEMFGGDATRVASQILPGIGFLGAGVIIREFGRGIIGLTTAAIVWVVAALGMMVGSDLPITAILVAALIILITYSLRGFERRLHLSRIFRYQLDIDPESDGSLSRVRSLMTIFSNGIKDLEIEEGGNGEDSATVRFGFVGPDDERFDFLKLIYEIPGVKITDSF